jgi:hypothetical protein
MKNVSGSAYSNPAFSMLRGTKLSLFGMQIDLAEFAEDLTDLASPQNLNGFLCHVLESSAREQVPPLPPTLKQAREYAHWFFMFLNTYTPLLDKRKLDDLVRALPCRLTMVLTLHSWYNPTTTLVQALAQVEQQQKRSWCI